MDNTNLLGTFIDTANKVRTSLKEKYHDQWNNPTEGIAEKKESNDDDE